MRTLTIVASLALLSLTTWLARAADPPAAPIMKATYLVTGLHCPPCTSTVEQTLRKTPGVKIAKVDWKSKNATIEFNEQTLSAQRLANTIAATSHMMGGGMKYEGLLILKISDWKDAQTGEKAKAALAKVPGVAQVSVYPTQQAVAVKFAESGSLKTDDLTKAVSDAGLKASSYP